MVTPEYDPVTVNASVSLVQEAPDSEYTPVVLLIVKVKPFWALVNTDPPSVPPVIENAEAVVTSVRPLNTLKVPPDAVREYPVPVALADTTEASVVKNRVT
jgi:hypothetical protein